MQAKTQETSESLYWPCSWNFRGRTSHKWNIFWCSHCWWWRQRGCAHLWQKWALNLLVNEAYVCKASGYLRLKTRYEWSSFCFHFERTHGGHFFLSQECSITTYGSAPSAVNNSLLWVPWKLIIKKFTSSRRISSVPNAGKFTAVTAVLCVTTRSTTQLSDTRKLFNMYYLKDRGFPRLCLVVRSKSTASNLLFRPSGDIPLQHFFFHIHLNV